MAVTKYTIVVMVKRLNKTLIAWYSAMINIVNGYG